MAGKSFEQLRVYQLADMLADQIRDMVQKWTALARDTVGKQIIKAADSIGANIAEGYGRGSYQDNHRFVRMARGSLYETRHWLRRAYQRKLLADTQTNAATSAAPESVNDLIATTSDTALLGFGEGL